MRRAVLLAALVAGCAGLLLVPHADPGRTDLTAMFAGPSAAHPLGTDHLGRDLLARLLTGFGRTLTVVASAAAIAAVVGTVLGLIAGWFGGPVRLVVQSVTDLLMVVPSFVAALIVAAVLGLNPLTTGVTLGLFGTGPYVNQTAALVRGILGQDHITAERLLGTPSWRIVTSHLLPPVLPSLRAYLGATAGGSVLSYAGLAYIGLGIDTTTPDWGSMLYDHRVYLTDHPLLVLAPMAAIALLALALHLSLDEGVPR